MRLALLSFVVPLLFLFHTPEVNTLKGKVVMADSRKPVSNVLVYVIEGEEESLTNSKGEFSIKTRKDFPVEVTAQQLSGRKSKVKVTAQSSGITIEFP